MSNPQPVCLVVSAPESAANGAEYLFDRVIRPAIERAGLAPLHIGAQVTTASLREQLALAEVAVIDLSESGHRPLYSMGVREALHPARTQYICAAGADPAETPSSGTVLKYQLDDTGALVECFALRTALEEGLRQGVIAAAPGDPSGDPLVRLLQSWPTPLIARLKTDVFRRQVDYSPYWRKRLKAPAWRATQGPDGNKVSSRPSRGVNPRYWSICCSLTGPWMPGSRSWLSCRVYRRSCARRSWYRNSSVLRSIGWVATSRHSPCWVTCWCGRARVQKPVR